MKISFLSRKPGAGFALIVLMASLVVILLAFASVMWWLASNSNQTKHNNAFTASEAAAEGATETAFAAMDRDFLLHALNTGSNFYTGVLPSTNGWPIQFIFSDTNGNAGQISVNMGNESTNLQPLDSQFGGLEGFPQTNTITATATPVGQLYNVPATVSQTIVFAAVPAFQFAIFYNLNLEIDPGATMPISGPVFSNQGIWSGDAYPTYSSTVEAVHTVNTSGTDPYCTDYTDAGTPAGNFTLSGQPVNGVNPLNIPIGATTSASTNNSATNVEAIISIPPPGACAPQSIAYVATNLTYDYNAASLIISNSPNGVNILGGSYTPTNNTFSVWLQDSIQNPQAVTSNGVAVNWLQLTNDYYIVTNNKTATRFQTNYVPNFQFTNMSAITWTNNPPGTNRVWYAGFSFLTNVAFYDFRESRTDQAVQVDISLFRAWITNNAANGGSNWDFALCKDLGQGINSIFVYNAVHTNSQQLPAVLLVNGQRLPNSTNSNVLYNGAYSTIVTSGLTVVTPMPLYVFGNYNDQIDGSAEVSGSANTADTYPAGLFADAITILSTGWSFSDSPSVNSSYSSRTPVSTTINAACLEGIVQSTGTNYSGGVENFLRLEENWSSSITLTYNGSIMVMFPSLYATAKWQPTGNYYNAPKRVWGFDTNFLVQSELPPLTPQFRTVVRYQWAGF